MHKRETILNNLRESPEVDVLIIGGGVNGIGTFRDLALQGVNVLLAERDDFCAGASAASSHMLHGGIRYLENGEFRLVREALHERNRMLRNAPHYSHPLPTTIPMFRWFSGMLNAPMKFMGWLNSPSERGAIVIKLGLMMYDAFTADDRTMPTHDFDLRPASLRKYPRLNPDVVCTATYYDAWMSQPERICVDMVHDAEKANSNAWALNYFGAIDGGGDTVTLEDSLTGDTYDIKPKVVINAAGPWIDFVNKAMEQQTRFMGGTKGSHLVLEHPELHEATGGHEFFFENDDGRIVLIFPYLNRVLVGTTDIPIDDPDEAVCTDDEVDYILGMIPNVFPDIDVTREHIVYTFSGVRPLPASDADNPGQVSRDHSIKSVGPNQHLNFRVHSLIGGKWTSFRAFSEEATDKVLGELSKMRKVDTRDMAIGGGKNYPKSDSAKEAWFKDMQQSTELSRETLETLFERYGTRARQVAEFMGQANDAPLEHLPDYTRRELTCIAQNEKVEHVDDYLQRRSLVAMLGYATPEAIEEVAQVLAEALDWDETRTQDEVDRMMSLLREKHRMDLIQADASASV
jgi:glycerol-3-phosphate dehydrogenase